jgi:type VI secretion system protein ImpC
MPTEPQAAAAAPSALPQEVTDLVEKAIVATKPQTKDIAERTRSYLEAYLDSLMKPDAVISSDVEVNINHWISEIDKKLSAQLNEIMHAPEFQRLEGTWRGLKYLIDNSEIAPDHLEIKVLNVTKRELFRDLTKAREFDQSQLFKKVYEAEYGMFGGKPYGMLVGDFEFDHYAEDMTLLTKLSNVAAAAHAPFVSAASPKMFAMDRFTELGTPRDLSTLFASVEHTKWKSFRDSEDSRYVALTMPHVLGRLPYGEKFATCEAFNFNEFVDGKDHDKYLWMNASWAYAARVTDAFAKDGWFARTRGPEGGGKVENLPVHTFASDDGDVVMKCPTEIAISDRREFELANLGFMALLHAKNTDYSAFFASQSCNKPKKYMGPEKEKANANAELSAKFNYLLIVSRFAHYLKVMARDKIGSFMEVDECQRWLNTWISDYVIANPEMAGDEMKAKHPLREAEVKVEAVPGKPGWYQAVAWLRPHFQLETLTTSLRLVAEVPKRTG